MLITADQLLAHACGDYILQSDWMATEKTKKSIAAFVHAMTYTIPFLLLTTSVAPLLVISGTHFVIDRWRLARYVVWAKNFIAPPWIEQRREIVHGQTQGTGKGHLVDASGKVLAEVPMSFTDTTGEVIIEQVRNYPWKECAGTGYHESRPPFLAVWLLIIADNILHVLINGLALKYLV